MGPSFTGLQWLADPSSSTPPDGSCPRLQADQAHLASALVREREPDLVICGKAWPVRNASGRFAKGQFHPRLRRRAGNLPGHDEHAVLARRTVPYPHLSVTSQ
jgi:hypothetical protein